MIAIVEAYRAGLLQSKHWGSNISSGLIVGIVALPLAMAFAIASGVKPEQGLYTAIIAGLFVGIFGGSRVQIAGPTGAFVVILANITAKYGIDGLHIATLLAGLILIFMGMAKLGNVIKFIPDPVIVGFTSGIGFIIFVGEWKDFFGLSAKLPLEGHFHQKLLLLFKALPSFSFAATGIACLSLILVLSTQKFLKRIPGSLAAIFVAALIQAYFHFKNVPTLGSTFGGISQQLPQLHFPSIKLSHTLDLIEPAFTIALLGAIESLLSASTADSMMGTRHNSNQELIGQGLANIFSPLFGGFAATGAIARTATNVRNGGTSPVSAIVHSIVLLLIILLLAPLAAHIPLCTLAAILFVVAYKMSDIPHFIHMIKNAPRYDVIVLLITFFMTIFTNLVIAVNVGVIFAMLFFIRRMTQLVTVEEQTPKKLQEELKVKELDSLLKNTTVFSIQGPFFFGVAEKIELALARINTKQKTIIFRLQDVPFMDITGLKTFYELIKQYQKQGVKIYLCEANMRVFRKLMNIGLLHLIEEKKVFQTITEIFETCPTSFSEVTP